MGKKMVLNFFIGYKNDEKANLLCIKLPKMSGWVNRFKETKYMSFYIKDDQLLKKYKEIWYKISNTMQKGFDR